MLVSTARRWLLVSITVSVTHSFAQSQTPAPIATLHEGVDCHTLFAPGSGVSDFLDDQLAICPSRDDESRPGSCPSGLRVVEEGRPGSGQLGDVNKIPNFEIEDLFLDAGYYAACRDIFAEPGFSAPVSRIPAASAEVLRSQPHWERYPLESLEPLQRSMATVLASITNWSYCHRVYEEGPFVIHAEFRKATGSILLYQTACQTTRLYNEEIADLGAGHRFHLVAGHEVGHAIDSATGDSDRDQDPTRAEIRATIYGTYIARCLSRQFQALVRTNIADAETELQTRQAECLIQRWEAVDRRLAEIGSRGPAIDADSLASIQGSLGCVSRRTH